MSGSIALRCAILVLSDRASRGQRIDTSGPALADWLDDNGHPGAAVEILPDEQERIAAWLARRADSGEWDVVLTCGGTGVSARDVTPEATRAIIDREIPGFAERMRSVSFASTPRALVSRALAGTRAGTLIINLPGSPRAALENLSAVWPAVPHLVAKLQGDLEDCGAE